MSDEMKKQMEEQAKLLEQMQREAQEYEQKLAAQQAAMEAKRKEEEMLKDQPHLKNINSDPSMSGTVKKALKANMTFGKANSGF